MVVHPTMEFKFCFSYVLLLTFTAVNEVTYVIGFTCDRLLDVVCFRVMVTGYGCGEVSFFADGKEGSAKKDTSVTVITNPITKYDKLFWKYLLNPYDPIFSFLGTRLLAVVSTFGEVYVNATKRKHFSKTGTTLFLGDFGLDVCCNSALSALP